MLQDKLQLQFQTEVTLLITVSWGALEDADSARVALEGTVGSRQCRGGFRRTIMILHLRRELAQFLRGAKLFGGRVQRGETVAVWFLCGCWHYGRWPFDGGNMLGVFIPDINLLGCLAVGGGEFRPLSCNDPLRLPHSSIAA